ncbi:hypothetical protein DHW03_02660 [Pedobacter yonginense]|uniref:HTH araC/xylS-type domain-containing protein n=1 Tax=Pedobacter yonginense TaxID=651869 RepID=A0A317EPI5_9SPHI|nr:helix-turn-helix domain-containing protein [Pedobacter yonginense]PWS28761.1 hypothetical protein DHW03_02660 [Pedobacter yonginense]
MHPFFLTLIGAIFIFSLILIKLFLYGKNKRYLNLWLSISITGITWFVLIYLLTNSGQIKNYPFLFNKGLPFYYLIAPGLYLYIRGSLNSAYATFKKADLLHLLLIIPAIISILPYNLLSYHEQQLVVNHITTDVKFAISTSKYVVSPLHWFAFPATACIYCGFQFWEIKKASKSKTAGEKSIKWLYAFTSVCAALFVGILVMNFSVLENFNRAWFIMHNSTIVFFLCFCVLLISFLFFLHPEFLYGFKPMVYQRGLETAVVENEFSEKLEKNDPKIRKIDAHLAARVEAFLNETEVFRQTGLTLSGFASLIDIPNHKLTELFNHHFKLNFNSYINKLRIEYAKARLDDGDWKQFTLEAIANDAGFSSRNTFFVAFKKLTGLTPSGYISRLKDGKL